MRHILLLLGMGLLIAAAPPAYAQTCEGMGGRWTWEKMFGRVYYDNANDDWNQWSDAERTDACERTCGGEGKVIVCSRAWVGDRVVTYEPRKITRPHWRIRPCCRVQGNGKVQRTDSKKPTSSKSVASRISSCRAKGFARRCRGGSRALRVSSRWITSRNPDGCGCSAASGGLRPRGQRSGNQNQSTTLRRAY